MKRFLLATVFCCGMMLASPAYTAEQTVTMKIDKMTCALCPLTVRKAMERVDGVQDVSVDYDNKTAIITFDDTKTTAATIAQASTDVGDPATPVKD